MSIIGFDKGVGCTLATLVLNEKKFYDVELVVFDKDGTLIDLYHYWSVMLKLRADMMMELMDIDSSSVRNELMDAMGVDLKNGKIKRNGPVGLFPRTVVQKAAEDYLADRNISDLHKKCTQAFLSADERSQSKLLDLLKLKNGIIEFLSAIKNKGLKTAIATSDKTERTRIIIDALGLNDYFDMIVGFDSVKNPKPHPESLDLINTTLGVKPGRSVFFGDTCSDAEMGHRAGYLKNFILISDLTNVNQLNKFNHCLFNGFSDIIIKD